VLSEIISENGKNDFFAKILKNLAIRYKSENNFGRIIKMGRSY